MKSKYLICFSQDSTRLGVFWKLLLVLWASFLNLLLPVIAVFPAVAEAQVNNNARPIINIQSLTPRVDEGDVVTFQVFRSPNQPAMNVRISLDFHSKIFDSESTTPSNQHLVQFEENEQVKNITFVTDDDALNEGDGMIRADLDLSTTAISAYRVVNESAWARVKDDDIPEVTLSLSTNSIVEGEPLLVVSGARLLHRI